MASAGQRNLNKPKLENVPLLGDLHRILLEQPEKEARLIATALEIYVTGSLNVFNHRTNVNIQNRLVCFDIKELGKQLKKLGMLIVQDQVWGRVTANRAEGKSTRYYIDGSHLLLKEEQTAAYSVEIWTCCLPVRSRISSKTATLSTCWSPIGLEIAEIF
jgi:hypothetical protein